MALDIGSLVGYLALNTDQFDTDLDGVGGKLKRAGKKLAPIANAAGLAAGAALAGGVVGAINVEQGNAKLAAQLGATGPTAKRLGKVAGSVYADGFGDSMSAVDDAIASVVHNIGGMRNASSKQLKGVTKQVLSLSNVFDQDLGQTTRAVGTLMRTGLAKNAKQALDIITKGMQTGANKADDLLDTINEYGTQFRKLGLSGKQSMGLLRQGLQGGARDADVVADSLKEFSIRAVDGSKLTAKGFKMLGLDGEKMAHRIGKGGKSANKALDKTLDRLRGIKDPVKRSKAAVALFGTQAEDLGKALYKLDPSKATKAMGKTEGATKKLGNTMQDTAAAKLEKFKRAATQAFTQLGAQALPVLKPLLGLLKQYSGVLVPVAAGFAGLLAAIKIGSAVASTAQAISTFAKSAKLASAAAKVWTAVQWLLNAAMSANPIGIVVIAIAALVAAFIIAYKKSATFRKIVHAALHGVKVAAMAVWHWLKNSFVPFFTKTIPHAWHVVAHFAKKIWGGIKKVAKVVWHAIMAVIRGYVNTVLAVVGWFARLPGRIRAWFGRVKDAAVAKLRALVDWVRTVPGKVKRALGNAAHILLAKGKALIQGLLDGVRNAMRGIKSWLKKHVWNPIVKGVKALFGIKSPSTVFAGFGVQMIRGLIRGLIKGNPGKFMKKVLGGASKLGGQALMWLVDHGKLAWSKLSSLGASAWKKLSGWFGFGGGNAGAGVRRWIPQVRRALALLGQPMSLVGDVLSRMKRESGGNPRAINNWDVNARRGDPSRGLMQTIGSTFRAFAGPFRRLGIWNPFANIYAGLNYALHRYPSLAYAMNKPGGYARGTRSARRGWAWVGENGPELLRFKGGERVLSNGKSQQAVAGGPRIGQVVFQQYAGSARAAVEELAFELRRLDRGGVYAGAAA